MKVVHLNTSTGTGSATREWAKVLVEKWQRRDKIKAKKWAIEVRQEKRKSISS